MAKERRIENDEAYNRSLAWLVTKAAILEDPLLDPAEREKLQRQYDYVADKVERYKRGQLVQMFPGLREQYRILGWPFDDPEATVSDKPTPSPPPAESRSGPVAEAKPAAAVALAGWLDND